MAGISEIYTAKAMLDSQMVHMGKQGEKTNMILTGQFIRQKSHSNVDQNRFRLLFRVPTLNSGW